MYLQTFVTNRIRDNINQSSSKNVSYVCNSKVNITP